MRHRCRSITWDDQVFQFKPLYSAPLSHEATLWAVSRQGEFIGIMPCSPEASTREFDVRSLEWLRELLGTPKATHRR
jgi:hypothetical protein